MWVGPALEKWSDWENIFWLSCAPASASVSFTPDCDAESQT